MLIARTERMTPAFTPCLLFRAFAPQIPLLIRFDASVPYYLSALRATLARCLIRPRSLGGFASPHHRRASIRIENRK